MEDEEAAAASDVIGREGGIRGSSGGMDGGWTFNEHFTKQFSDILSGGRPEIVLRLS